MKRDQSALKYVTFCISIINIEKNKFPIKKPENSIKQKDRRETRT